MSIVREAAAATAVFWNINRCPVPAGLDPCLVRPGIKRFLETQGYDGPLTISAFGDLTSVPEDTLRGVYGSGISLAHSPCRLSGSIKKLIDHLTDEILPPANIMLISRENSDDYFGGYAYRLQTLGYNLVQPFPCLSLQNILHADDFLLNEEETVASAVFWNCFACGEFSPGHGGFENYLDHISTPEHHEKTSKWFAREKFLLRPCRREPPNPKPNPSLISRKFAPRPFVIGPSGYREIDREALKLVSETLVFWEINECPLPAHFDPSLVRPLINQFLSKLGYCVDHVTIVAIGELSDVPIHILEPLSDSGITLRNVSNGSEGTVLDMLDLCFMNGPPANVLVISANSEFFAQSDDIKYVESCLLTLHQPFPYPSLSTLISSGAIEGKEGICCEKNKSDCFVCSEKDLSPSFVCSSCLPEAAFKSFKDFMTHVSCGRHDITRTAPIPIVRTPDGFLEIDREALKTVSETLVFWEINNCPVPASWDPLMVGPCITRFLNNEGYCVDHVTIVAIGELSEVPIDILGMLFDSGITLRNVSNGSIDTEIEIKAWSPFVRGQPLANIMIISANSDYFARCGLKIYLGELERNLLEPFPYPSLEMFSHLYSATGAEKKQIRCEKNLSDCFACSEKKERNVEELPRQLFHISEQEEQEEP